MNGLDLDSPQVLFELVFQTKEPGGEVELLKLFDGLKKYRTQSEKIYLK